MGVLKQEAAIEAVLFAAGDAVSLSKLAQCVGQDVKTTKLIMDRLLRAYNRPGRGVHILELGDSYQMCTNPEFFEYVRQLAHTPSTRALTPALLETLAIIAYKQPVTKAQIEQVRGVNADHAVNKLAEYGLVVEKGRQDAPGRPILFGTSEEFLRHFGFSGLSKLPMLEGDYERLRKEAEAECNIFSQNKSN